MTQREVDWAVKRAVQVIHEITLEGDPDEMILDLAQALRRLREEALAEAAKGGT